MFATFNTDQDEIAVGDDPAFSLYDGLASFLIAGAVLFASLVIGSAVSLLLAGSDRMISAIMRGFLSLGLSALGVFVVAALLAVGLAAFRHTRDA